MRRIDIAKVLGRLRPPPCCSSCMCTSTVEDQEDLLEMEALMTSDEMVRLKEMFEGDKTLAFHLEPKTVVLKVSMHCDGCAKQVKKRLSRIDGVTSLEVDLENQKVAVTGDVTPFEVLKCVSKVKYAQFWDVTP